jgi:hypothetical protein
MTADHRLYRRTDRVLVTPAVPGRGAYTFTEKKYLCGWYPKSAISAANKGPVVLDGYAGAPLRGPGAFAWAGLNFDLLVRVPPEGALMLQADTDIPLVGPGAEAAQAFSAAGSAYVYLCAEFDVPAAALAVTGSTAVYKDAAVPGWDAGAVSVASFFGNGRVSFRVGSGGLNIVGMIEGADPLSPGTQFFGFIFGVLSEFSTSMRSYDSTSLLSSSSGGTSVAHAGDRKKRNFGVVSDVGQTIVGHTENTIFSIERLHDTITYKVDGAVFSQDTFAPGAIPSTVMSLAAALYRPGTMVVGLEVYGFTVASGVLSAFTGRGGAGAAKSGAHAALPTLRPFSRAASRANTALPRLRARGGRLLAEANAALPKMTTTGAGGFDALGLGAVGLNRSAGKMPSASTRGSSTVGTVGQSSAAVPAMLARGGKVGGAGGSALPGMRTYGLAIPADEAAFYSSTFTSGRLSFASEILVVMNSAGVVSQVLGVVVATDATLPTAAMLSTPLTLSSILAAVMGTEVSAGSDVPLYEQAGEVWAVSLAEDAATSTFEDYPFNSFGTIGGRAFGAKQDGVFRLEGDTDGGAPIRSSVSYGKQDFGTKTEKHMTRAYVGASSTGALYLKVIAGGAEHVYAARSSSAELAQQRFDVGRGIKGNYFTFELFNKNGGDFEIDSVSFFAAEFKRRI